MLRVSNEGVGLDGFSEAIILTIDGYAHWFHALFAAVTESTHNVLIPSSDERAFIRHVVCFSICNIAANEGVAAARVDVGNCQFNFFIYRGFF